MYIVWILHGMFDEWLRSQYLETLDDCFEYLRDHNHGNEYIITKLVEVEFKEK